MQCLDKALPCPKLLQKPWIFPFMSNTIVFLKKDMCNLLNYVNILKKLEKQSPGTDFITADFKQAIPLRLLHS